MSSLITSNIISKATLINFENNLVIANKADWQYSENFGKGDAQIGASFAIRRPIMVIATDNNMAWNAGNSVVSESKVNLTVDRTLTVPMSFSDSDLALKVERFTDRFISKATAVIAAKLDAAIAQAISNCSTGTSAFEGAGYAGASINAGGYVVGTFTSALTPDVIAQARQVLQDKGCPMDESALVGVLSTQANRRLVLANATIFNPLLKVDGVYRKGYIGEFDGIEFSVSQSLVAHTNGGQAAVTPSTAASTESSTGWVESATVTVPALTGTVNAGDTFAVAGVYVVNPFTKAVTSTQFQFTVVATANVGATSLTVTPAPILTGAYQNISSTLSGKVSTLVDAINATGVESIIFHKNAIALASIELSLPKKSSYDMAELITDPDVDGFKLRFLRTYDLIGASNSFGGGVGVGGPGYIARFDVAYGIKTAQPEFIVRVRTN